MKTLANVFLGLFIFKAVLAAPPTAAINYDTDTYEVDLEELDSIYDYDGSLSIDQGEIEIGTVLPVVNRPIISPEHVPEEEEEAEESTPKLIDGSSPQGPLSPGVLVPETSGDISTCILCTCIRTTVYCDDHNLDSVPPLPRETTHVYLRFNRITKINKNDFANLNKLQKLDLTSNIIEAIDEDAFRSLSTLNELILRDNRLRQLPELPNTLNVIDVSHNRLGRKGIKHEAFKDMNDLHLLYLTDNSLDHIPIPLPDSLQALHLQDNNIQEMHEDTFCKMKDFSYSRRALEDIRLDGNPINLSKTPQAFMCLPRIPVGRLV
ncbi:epiphycan [Spea bombifrons]|uniref:epiphycan n=1 Tax=Spea bombifrons TaxID=233779 RepID=UPI00234A14A3|nr:epiphycan [Spea bombifrons]XP_053320507.1 epiphycan [Spea bombifrons]